MEPRRSHRIAAGLGLAASLAVLGLQAAGVLAPIEAVVTDQAFRLRGPRPPQAAVAIVAIDEESIDCYGRWPWPRTLLARLIDRIAAAGAAVVALDIILSEPSRSPPACDLSSEDQELAASIGRAGNVVLGYFFRQQERGGEASPAGCPASRDEGAAETESLPGRRFRVLGGGFPVPDRPAVEANLELFARAAAAQGFFSTERESGVLRHYPTVNRYRERYYPALAVAAVATYLDAPLVLAPYQGRLPQVEVGDRWVLTDESGRLWVDYLGGAGTIPTVSAADVLAGGEPPPELAGAVVFLGATETGIGDLHATPFGAEVPGVEVHATVAENVLAGRFIHDTAVQLAVSVVAVLLLGPLVALLVAAIQRHLAGSAAAIALVLVWPAAAYLAFRTAGWHLQVVAPVLAGAVSLVASLRYQIGWVERRARRIRETFRHYVSPAVVEEMLAQPERLQLGGERRRMTVLFCDIRGFTSLAEDRDPEEVVHLLNEFFTPMTALVLDRGGTLDKYMGDALMAFFGAPTGQPDHARRACRAALEMSRELARLNRRLRTEGRLPPEAPGLGIGIGVNSGEMSVGNMGSDQIFDYTVIGDEVNLGSRIEGLSRAYEVEIVVSGATREAAGPGFLFRELGRVQVKGRREAVTIHELVAERPAAGAEDAEWRRQAARVERFEEGLAAYRGRRFGQAAGVFEGLLAEAPDGPAELFLARCRAFEKEPPGPDWQAVERLTSK